jgi:hypothetical protein
MVLLEELPELLELYMDESSSLRLFRQNASFFIHENLESIEHFGVFFLRQGIAFTTVTPGGTFPPNGGGIGKLMGCLIAGPFSTERTASRP